MFPHQKRKKGMGGKQYKLGAGVLVLLFLTYLMFTGRTADVSSDLFTPTLGAHTTARVDMHVHTTESDADATVLQQLEYAKDLNLDSVWLTDHDMIRPLTRVREIQEEAALIGITIGLGVEITVLWNKKEHHLLGYFPNSVWDTNELSPELQTLQAACAVVKDSRSNRNSNLLSYLNTLLTSEEGKIYFADETSFENFETLDVDVISVWARTNADLFDASSLGRPHFNKYLTVVSGIRSDLIFGPRSGDGYGKVLPEDSYPDAPAIVWDADAEGKDGAAVQGLLHSGNLERRGIVFNPLPILEAIAMINAAGGKAVVAHMPTLGSSWYEKFHAPLGELKEAGLWGVEAYSSEVVQDSHELIHAMALEFDLVETGGSDNHGTLKPYAKIGDVFKNFGPEDIQRYNDVGTWETIGGRLSQKVRSGVYGKEL